MKKIDIENWKRKKHYDFYKDYTYPHFSVTANINVTKLVEYSKKHKISFFPSFLYVVMKAMNSIDNFKYRIRGEEVVLHDFISPSYTVLNEDELYVFCTTIYDDDYETYIKKVIKDIEKSKKGNRLEDIPGKDDLVFVSSLPWTSFTSTTHPIDVNHPDSFPRILWGRYFKENEKYLIPLNIFVHHGLCDGLHVARFFEQIEKNIDELFG